jgi:hypothetical protein
MGVPWKPAQGPDEAEVIREVTPLVQAALGVACVLTALCVPLVLDVPLALKTWLVYLLPLPAALLLFLAICLDLQGTKHVSDLALVGGIAFIVSGIVFDVTATVVHSPDLEREGNPVARVLLDSRHQLKIVYIYGLTGQTLIGLILCTWWAAFLAHQQVWLNRVMALEPRSFLDFLRYAIGGGELTWRQILFALDLPSLYRTCYYWSWIIGPSLILSMTAARFYVGLKWFELVPDFSPYWVWLGCLILTVIIYIVWLHGEYTLRTGGDSPAE